MKDIDKLKEDFKSLTGREAADAVADFAAYLHLLQLEKTAQLYAFLEMLSIEHRPSWAEVKNFHDKEHTD